MAKQLTLYQCSFCDHTLKTEKGILKHEKSCTKNPAILDIEKNIEDIRCTSTSIVEVVERLKTYLLTLGIKLHFSRYPDTYSTLVRNGYNAPAGYKTNFGRSPSIPTGYPGWSGSWVGQLEVVDSSILGISKKVYFTDLLRGAVCKELKVPFIHTGGGGEGSDSDFRYEGMFFVYDFPKIHEKYLAEGGAISDLSHHYSQVVGDYFDKLNTERSHKVSWDPKVRKLGDLKKQAQDLIKVFEDATLLREKDVRSQFNESYEVPLPLPPDPFCADSDTLKKIQSATYSEKAKPAPELKAYANTLNELVAQMNKLKTENPEYFL